VSVLQKIALRPREIKLISLCNSELGNQSIVSIEIYDNRKFKKRDQGFLGSINIPTGEATDYADRGGA
jgi:hypothetical protein